MSLYDDVTEALQDRDTIACVMESELDPVTLRGTPISPPTYAPASGANDKIPNYAVTANAFMPEVTDGGWHNEVARDRDGNLRLVKRVVVHSTGACAHASGVAAYAQQERLGVTWPAFVLDGSHTDPRRVTQAIKAAASSSKAAKAVSEEHHDHVERTLHTPISSWELAHRTADSWLQYADSGAGQQIWADPSSSLKQTLLNISHEQGELVYAYAPNVAVFGAWLSAGTARRHAIPRAYSCEITGFGVHEITRGATKLDPTGGTVARARKISATPAGISLEAKGSEPSKLGFGQVPALVATRGYVCELILRQASISLRALEKFQYSDDDTGAKALAATRVYVLLAMAGHLLAGEDSFLRSGCDLVTVAERWGWRAHGRREPIDMQVPTIDETAQALRRAVADAEAVGLTFHAPITVGFSDAEIGLIADRVLFQANDVEAESQ